ncbi:MAG: hypothetical protein JWP11_1901, partial [Frankiales bacterium]|nr:hypothetical protein [Frankiales bacterium]
MASRFWVAGGTGVWNATDTNNWSATSGGLSGASVPTAADDVFFDALSGVGAIANTGGGVCLCRNLTMTGFAGSTSGGAAVICQGSVTLGSSMTGNLAWALTLSTPGSTSVTLTSAGKTISAVTLNGFSTSTTTLGDALSTPGALVWNAGTFNTASFSITADSFSFSNSNTRTLTMGASSITISGVSTP